MRIMNKCIVLVSSALMVMPITNAADLKSENEKISYSIGFQFGSQIARDLKLNNIDVDAKQLAQAVEDVISGAQPKLSVPEMQGVMQAFKEKKMQEQKVAADKNEKAGTDFLAENKKKKGITELPSGLQYQVVEKGKGKKPSSSDTVEVNYRGTLINGTEFDSSFKRGKPAIFKVNGVIPGWTEALQLMEEGAKWKIYVPSKLAYGARGAGPSIGPNETLIFDIELLSVKDDKEAKAETKK